MKRQIAFTYKCPSCGSNIGVVENIGDNILVKGDEHCTNITIKNTCMYCFTKNKFEYTSVLKFEKETIE